MTTIQNIFIDTVALISMSCNCYEVFATQITHITINIIKSCLVGKIKNRVESISLDNSLAQMIPPYLDSSMCLCITDTQLCIYVSSLQLLATGYRYLQRTRLLLHF